MKIITLTCPECGTIVAANELEERRIMKCPGLECEAVLRFDDIEATDREYVLEQGTNYGFD